MAATLWQKLQQYAGQEVPRVLTGWLDGQHRKEGAIDLVVVEELQKIREAVNP